MSESKKRSLKSVALAFKGDGIALTNGMVLHPESHRGAAQ